MSSISHCESVNATRDSTSGFTIRTPKPTSDAAPASGAVICFAFDGSESRPSETAAWSHPSGPATSTTRRAERFAEMTSRAVSSRNSHASSPIGARLRFLRSIGYSFPGRPIPRSVWSESPSSASAASSTSSSGREVNR